MCRQRSWDRTDSISSYYSFDYVRVRSWKPRLSSYYYHFSSDGLYDLLLRGPSGVIVFDSFLDLTCGSGFVVKYLAIDNMECALLLLRYKRYALLKRQEKHSFLCIVIS